MRITFKAFDSKMASREKLFKAGLEFANKLEPDKLITITHSEDRDNIVLTVWYWTEEVDKAAQIKAQVAADVAKLPSGSSAVEAGPTGDLRKPPTFGAAPTGPIPIQGEAERKLGDTGVRPLNRTSPGSAFPPDDPAK